LFSNLLQKIIFKATSPILIPTRCSLPLTDNNELNPNVISSHRRSDVFFSSDPSTELAGTGLHVNYVKFNY